MISSMNHEIQLFWRLNDMIISVKGCVLSVLLPSFRWPVDKDYSPHNSNDGWWRLPSFWSPSLLQIEIHCDDDRFFGKNERRKEKIVHWENLSQRFVDQASKRERKSKSFWLSIMFISLQILRNLNHWCDLLGIFFASIPWKDGMKEDWKFGWREKIFRIDMNLSTSFYTRSWEE